MDIFVGRGWSSWLWAFFRYISGQSDRSADLRGLLGVSQCPHVRFNPFQQAESPFVFFARPEPRFTVAKRFCFLSSGTFIVLEFLTNKAETAFLITFRPGSSRKHCFLLVSVREVAGNTVSFYFLSGKFQKTMFFLISRQESRQIQCFFLYSALKYRRNNVSDAILL